MAKIPMGILGALIGTLGPVTGKKWLDENTLSSRRKQAKTDTDPTPNQDNQRTKFGFVSHFHGGSSDFVKLTFKEVGGKRTAFQRAISYNANNAVSGTKPDFKIHYDRVAVGRGALPNAVLPEAKTGDTPGDIHYTWADNTGIGTAAANDIAIAVAYCPAYDQWIWCKPGTATRADGSVSFSVPAFSGKTVHTWLTFATVEGKSSDSIYTGELQVK